MPVFLLAMRPVINVHYNVMAQVFSVVSAFYSASCKVQKAVQTQDLLPDPEEWLFDGLRVGVIVLSNKI